MKRWIKLIEMYNDNNLIKSNLSFKKFFIIIFYSMSSFAIVVLIIAFQFNGLLIGVVVFSGFNYFLDKKGLYEIQD